MGDHESHPTPEMVKYLEFKTGVVTTGSSFDHTAMDDKIMEENGKNTAAAAGACEGGGCIQGGVGWKGGRERASSPQCLWPYPLLFVWASCPRCKCAVLAAVLMIIVSRPLLRDVFLLMTSVPPPHARTRYVFLNSCRTRRRLNADARVKDMEAAGFAWACEQHGTPAFCVKVVTDLVDGGGVGEVRTVRIPSYL